MIRKNPLKLAIMCLLALFATSVFAKAPPPSPNVEFIDR